MSQHFTNEERFAETVRYTSFVNLALSVLGFGSAIFIARKLGADGRGELVSVQLFPMIMSLVFAVGLPHSSSFFVANNPKSARTITMDSALLALAFGVVGTIVSSVANWVYLSRNESSDEIRFAGIASSITVVLLPILGVLIHSLRSVNRFRMWNILRFLLDSSVLAIVFAILFGARATIVIILAPIVWLLFLLGISFITWSRQSKPIAEHIVTKRNLLAYGFPTMLATLPYFLNFRLDQIFIGAWNGSESLGVYATAVTWSAASLPVLSIITVLVLPRLANTLHGQGDEEVLIIRSCVVLALLTSTLLAVSGPIVIPIIFGQEFSDAGGLSIPLSFATSILGVLSTCEEVLRARGKPKDPARAQLIGLAINCGLLIILVPAHGPWGAVFASLGAYTLVLIIEFNKISTTCSVPLRELIPRKLDLIRITSFARTLLRKSL